METFQANVQYNDWKGTAAADNADQNDIRKLLNERGMISDDEFLIGIDLWLGEMHGQELAGPGAYALIIDAKDYREAERKLNEAHDPLSFKRVRLDLSMEEFLLLFKRFAVSLSWKGFDLTGHEYVAIDVP
ncbi:MAG: hypothetical protein O7A66_08615 [Alphaproteobacteria bacterium]|nr:hypothetical protein [Alphaproteobacteria bacterium]